MNKGLSLLQYVKDKGFFHLLSVNFLAQFLGFGSSLLVAKLLSPVELGNIRIFQSYSAIFIVFAGFGINSAILKICSEKYSETEKTYFLHYGINYSFLSTFVTIILLVVFSLTGLLVSSKHLSCWFLIYSLIIPFAVLTDIFIVYLQSQKRIQEMAKAQIIIKAQSFILIIAAAWLWGFKGFIFATIISYILGLIPLLRQVKMKFLKTEIGLIPSNFKTVAFYSFLANGVSVLGRYADIYILDHFYFNRAEIGCYSLATIFTLAASQVTGTVQSIVTPYFSEKANDKIWYKRQLITNQIRLAIISILVAIIVFISAVILVKIFYGTQYGSTIKYLPLLLLKYVLWSSSVVIGVGMFGLGLVHQNFLISLTSTILSIVLSFFLLKNMGIFGVAWGQVGATIIILIIQIFLIKKTIN
jgi:O-antigen/teichoic acid export membrane protein